METNELFQIDLQAILQSKAPQLARKIPRFAVNWLSRLICQDQLNECLRKAHGLTGVQFMQQKVTEDFNLTLALRGTENLPTADHRCIFASNHPLGGLDGICLSAVLGAQYDGNIRYLVNDILYFIKPLQDIFIPINKHGAQGTGAVNQLNEAFASDNQIITFPAGLCSRKNNGQIHDLEWKKMFVKKAVEYQRDIIPVYFDAHNSNFFYNFAKFRSTLGLKINLEMLLLPREMFKAKGSTFTIYFGKAIPWQTLDASKTPQQWASVIASLTRNPLNQRADVC
ncbi:MAG: 1-acyl-sn-glycerol-3-phosphate acyltransferase [Candidatus Symbiothrix sp.]|nr:1-acyl-sn-glycerol-3-phosphate acyltransferase [Candidatus Symbiothrix sp.]